MVGLCAAGTAFFVALTAAHGTNERLVTSASSTAAPVLYAVTDGVRAGDGVTLTGAYLYGDLTIRYSLVGSDEEKTITAKGDSFGTGTTFVFPYGETAGIYDISVTTKNGTSEPIAMNAPRPLFIDKDEVYGGQIVNIVGRNMLASEYGACDEGTALTSLRVKLEKNGVAYELTPKNGGVLTGVKTSAENSATGEEILYSNPFKTAIRIPDGIQMGDYTVSVSTDGETYGVLDNGQLLTIVQKKAAAYDQTVFSATQTLQTAVGNDPLGIGAAWAQDLNYQRTYTVNSNAATVKNLPYEQAKAAANTLSSTISGKISEFDRNGGGVIYFPEGEYYLSGLDLSDDVLLIGAGADKTTIYRVNEKGGSFIRGYDYSDGQVGYSNVGVANLTIEESDVSTGYPDYYVNLARGTAKSRDEHGVLRVSSFNKFLINVNVCSFTTQPSDYGNNERARVAVNSYKNTVVKGVNIDGGTCLSAEGYAYATVENVSMRAAEKIGDTPALQSKYAYVENNYFDLNYSAHGPSVRSDSYTAYTLTEHAGNREERSNDGEALLAEMASGYYATGEVRSAQSSSVTLDVKGTFKKAADEKKDVIEDNLITASSVASYNDYAVYIVSGTGAGQLRYIDQTKAERKDGNVFTYPLAADEKPWQVLPDATSKFTLIAPIKNLTVYGYKANDCVGSLCLYGNIFDAAVSDCTLADTAGIYLYSSDTGKVNGVNQGRITPNANVLIQRNSVTGVGAHYAVGSNRAQGTAGLLIDTQRYDDTSLSTGNTAIVVRNNEFCNLLSDNAPVFAYNPTGISLKTQGKKSATDGERGDLKYVVLENNVVDGAEAGVYAEARVTGLQLRNNRLQNIQSDKAYDIFVAETSYTRLATYTLINGEQTTLCDVKVGELLPTATVAGKKFKGWQDATGATYTSAYSDVPVTLTAAFSAPAELQYVSLSLEDKIGLNIGVHIDEKAFADESMKITLTQEGKTQTLHEPYRVDENGIFVYRAYFDPKDYEKIAVFSVEYEGNILVCKEFSVAKYIEIVLNDESYAQSHDLVRSLQTYCSAAKEYFSGKSVAEPSAEANKAAKDAVADYGEYDFSNTQTIKPSYMTLILSSGTKLRVYYKNDGGAASCFVNGKAVQSYVTKDGVNRYIEIADIYAKNLGERYEVTIGDTAFSVGAYDYVKRTFDCSNDKDLLRLLTALVGYGENAEKYFGGSV